VLWAQIDRSLKAVCGLSNSLLFSARVGRGEKEAVRALVGEAVDLPRLR